MHCNINGLCNKVQLLQDFQVDNFLADVLLISESHLTPLITDATVAIPGYLLLRNDSGYTPKHGVCAYVKESLRYDKVDISHTNCLSLRLTNLGLYVYVVYRPPSNSHDQNKALTEFLIHNCADKEVVLLGDFNLPSIRWCNQQPLGTPLGDDEMFLDMFTTLGLTQWVSEATFLRSGNMLDLILTSEQDRVGRAEVHPPPPGSDHCSLYCEYVFDEEVQSSSNGHCRVMWHLGHYDTISVVLNSIDWDFELARLSAQDAFSRLLSILQPLIEQHVPGPRLTC